ncbi:hypothetical protein [Salipiger mucosus]|uniref:Uncharacterized protein n=1 Tax=Salipiger mucosus DSM 16094 TaxID=1123237 RepID=S9S021_9RHOB|nr:hypothetical protein [Salipiger mucosus]EPX83560.1 hypothetical protein Salmuc_02168 [Salipiger mucosus DSM 16094]
MSDLQTPIDALLAEGFAAGMKTWDGQFFHRELNGDEEIAVYVTERTFPANTSGMNIWLQDSRNARPKHREDVLMADSDDPATDMLDRIACLEAFTADSLVEAVCTIQKRLGRSYSDVAHKAFPPDDPKAHKQYHRLQEYLEAERRRVAVGDPAQRRATIPALDGKVTPGLIYQASGFGLADEKPGFTRRTRSLRDQGQEIWVSRIETFDSVPRTQAGPSEGYVVSFCEEADAGIGFHHHIPEDEGGLVDQERAYMLAAAVEASRKPFVADGAEFLATVLSGERNNGHTVKKAFDMVHEDRYEELGAGDDELLWWQFMDDLHERTYGFSYEVENFLEPEREAAPAM